MFLALPLHLMNQHFRLNLMFLALPDLRLFLKNQQFQMLRLNQMFLALPMLLMNQQNLMFQKNRLSQ
jgi:hypothetical protein